MLELERAWGGHAHLVQQQAPLDYENMGLKGAWFWPNCCLLVILSVINTSVYDQIYLIARVWIAGVEGTLSTATYY